MLCCGLCCNSMIEPTSASKRRVRDIKMASNEGASLAFKIYILLVLTINATGYILLIRYTRSQAGTLYSSTTTVVLTEVFKLLISLVLLVKQHRSVLGMLNDVWHGVFLNPRDTFKMCVPSIIYAIQNNLAFVALSNLDAATYQVSYQMKVITTAMFMVLMLNKSLSKFQWLAILMLFMGVALVQVESAMGAKTGEAHYNYPIGLLCIVISCLCSGFAGVYFEKVLKGTSTSLWIRNVQMYMFGIVSGLIAVFSKDRDVILENGFLHGYNSLVWLVVAMASIGGLYTSVVVKYTDNIIKGFSTAVSIILAALGSFFLFHKTFGVVFVSGTGMVICAVYIYSLPKLTPPKPPTQPRETV